MLVITRRSGEWFQVSKQVKIYLTLESQGRIRVAIDAPRWMRVRRGEHIEDELTEDGRDDHGYKPGTDEIEDAREVIFSGWTSAEREARRGRLVTDDYGVDIPEIKLRDSNIKKELDTI